MTKNILIAGIVILSTAVTGWLIYIALAPAGGQPAVAAAAPEPQVLKAAYLKQTLALDRDAVTSPVWEKLPAVALGLKLQVTAIPWGKATVPEVDLRSFHDGGRIYFRFDWSDDSENREVSRTVFADACAVMFPLNGKDPQPESIMMGFLEPANIWAWKASRDSTVWGTPKPPETAYSDYYNPFVKQEVYSIATAPVGSAVEDLVANRIGTTTPKPQQNVRGRGLWAGNRWSVVMMRDLEIKGSGLDAEIRPGAGRMVAFAVWNGAKGDRGARKSISEWVRLEVAPVEESKP